MQTFNQSLSISLLACLKSMPIQYPAKKDRILKGCRQSSNIFDSQFASQKQIHLADLYVFHVLRLWANLISYATVPVEKKTN